MRKKTYKLQKLENNRYSIITDDMEHCLLCGATDPDIHEIYGGSNRKISMENGFCIPLCRWHHTQITIHPQLNKTFQISCQRIYEQTHTKEEFIKLIGKNYIGD